MTNTVVAPVVAGVDGSADARLAIDLAAWEADRRHAPLRLVCGFRQVYAYGVVATGYDLERQVRDLDDMLIAESARVARRYPDLPVATEVVTLSEAGCHTRLSSMIAPAEMIAAKMSHSL